MNYLKSFFFDGHKWWLLYMFSYVKMEWEKLTTINSCTLWIFTNLPNSDYRIPKLKVKRLKTTLIRNTVYKWPVQKRHLIDKCNKK